MSFRAGSTSEASLRNPRKPAEMRWYALTLTLLLLAEGGLSSQPDISMEEQLKAMTVKLNTMAAQYNYENAAMRKELVNLREELKACTSCNEKRNSQLTLEWAMETVAELRREMREMEAATNASGWQQELRNEVATILVEAEGVTKLAAADGVRLAAGEARDAELMLDIRQARDMATAAKATCDNIKYEMEKMQKNAKVHYRVLNKRINAQARSEFSINNDAIDDGNGGHKTRHMQSSRKQIDDIRRTHHNIFVMHRQMRGHLKDMQRRVDLVSGDAEKFESLMATQEKHAESIKNITAEVANFNKLHASMLELLENMETLENKIDKTVPDFRKEISKLDLDVAQIRSHNSYLKDDQENIRQSMKAVAVSVSNLVDKSNNDHETLERLNSTLCKLEGNLQGMSNNKTNYVFEEDYMKTETPKAAKESPLKICAESDNAVVGIQRGDGTEVKTKCEGGWILAQKRTNGLLDFNRNYREYAEGFGDPFGEFWIGNEALHQLTQDKCAELRINMVDTNGDHWRAEYGLFEVGPKDSGYRLNIGDYSGNASNALAFQNDMEFSTVDKDRDTSRIHCAASYQGGWWFSHCQHANLNGDYQLGLSWFNTARNEWMAMSGSQMLVRKKEGCVGA